MLLDEIFKTRDFCSLQDEMKRGSFPKVLLLVCKDNLYSQEFSKALAMLIMDEKVDLRSDNAVKIVSFGHPDLKIYPSKDKLTVADSEEIGDESHIKPILASKKVFIIHNFDDAADSAQNKLLKVLEEPSKNAYFLLECRNPNQVLPTIRSRCAQLELARLDDDTILRLLPKSENSALALACSDGFVGKALKCAKMKNLNELCTHCVEVFSQMKNSKQVLVFSRRLAEFKDEFDLILSIFAQIVEDLLKLKSGKIELVKLAPFESELKSCQADYTVRALCQIATLLDKVAMEKQYNVNITVVIENLLLNILEVKYLCR